MGDKPAITTAYSLERKKKQKQDSDHDIQEKEVLYPPQNQRNTSAPLKMQQLNKQLYGVLVQGKSLHIQAITL